MTMLLSLLFLATTANAWYPDIDGFRPFGVGFSHGVYPQDFSVVGPPLEAVHESQQAPTGLAVDSKHNIYITYPRNMGPTPNNVVIATGFSTEKPWPNAKIQNCTDGEDYSKCFVNVQNVVLDSIGQLWIVDSGFPANAEPGSDALYGGSKIMVCSITNLCASINEQIITDCMILLVFHGTRRPQTHICHSEEIPLP